jgi:hypothetical protein
MNDYFNVRSFGAVGDGVTNDAAAIQAAINALPAGGGIVYFPPGTYKVSTKISLPDKSVILSGSGFGSVIKLGTSAITLFEAPNGLTVTRVYTFEALRVTGNDGTNQTFFVNLDTSGFAWVTCRDCKIGGDNTNGLGIKTIFDYQAYDTTYTRLSRVELDNCVITPPTAAGAVLIKTSNPAGTYAGSVNLTATDCDFAPNDSGDLYKPWGIDLDGDIAMKKCDINWASGACGGMALSQCDIVVRPAGTFTVYGVNWDVFTQFTDCSFLAVAGLANVLALGAPSFGIDYSSVKGCFFNNVALHLIGNGGHDVVGNKWQDGDGTRSIYLNGVTRCVVADNIFANTGAVKTIQEAGGADFNAISGNNGTASGGGLALTGAATIAFEAGKNMA